MTPMIPKDPAKRRTSRRRGRQYSGIALTLVIVTVLAIIATFGLDKRPARVFGLVVSSSTMQISTVLDGAVPSGITVFSSVPAVSNLQPAFRDALRDAAKDASEDGVAFLVNSGWRDAKYQGSLLNDAVAQYGSRAEASRWVAPPDTSAHVTGDAIDIGSADATSWLSRHGATYGLCQTYANESWHYELRPEAIFKGCPTMYADATHDPRLHR